VIPTGQNAGMAGRPSKLTAQVEADLTLLLAQGVPVKLAASATDVSPRSVRRWLHEGDLRERVAEVRATEPTPADAISEARLVVLLLRASDWRASAWWLERRWPERWGAERMQP
jgi:transposase